KEPCTSRALASPHQPIDQRDLRGAHGDENHPDQRFANREFVLWNFAKPELHFETAEFQHIAVAKHRLLNLLAIGGDPGIAMGLQSKAGGGMKSVIKMFVQNARFRKCHTRMGRAPAPYRKMAGYP